MSKQPEDEGEDKPYTPNTGDQLDWFLQSIVSTASLIGPSLILNVGGLLIAGELIDGKTYFEEFAREIEEPLREAFVRTFSREEAGQSGAQIADSFRKFGDIYNPPAEGEKDSRARTHPSYVHLKNAKVYDPSGNSIPNNRGTLWRVRLTAVDGFTLGSFN